LLREFSAQRWDCFSRGIWAAERESARSREYNGAYRIYASDIDPKAVEIARSNAGRAGVSDLIRFEVADAAAFSRDTERGVIVTNPPYGERLLDKRQAEELYAAFGRATAGFRNGELFVLSSHADFERVFGRPAARKRRLYNGMIRCELYMYTEKARNKP
jgi:putative N6-adenine-specific DNA methylase